MKERKGLLNPMENMRVQGVVNANARNVESHLVPPNIVKDNQSVKLWKDFPVVETWVPKDPAKFGIMNTTK